ncbi:helix-turn-helix transcriptional regulator [Actinoplanes sp. CA-054009]
MRELADRAVTAADLNNESLTAFVRTVADSVPPSAPQSHAARLRSLAGALPAVPSPLHAGRARRRRIAVEAMMLLSAGNGSARATVRSAAQRLNVSERHLRTVFVDEIGLTPTDFIRIDRVRSVLADIRQSLTEVSVRSGYYDQSHMTAEFRRVMGATPHAFVTHRWPAIAGCTTGG